MDTTASTAAPRDDQASLADAPRHRVEDADRFLEDTRRGSDSRFAALRGKFTEQIHHMRTQLDDLEDRAIHQAHQAGQRVDLAVQSHPYRAIGLSAAAGLLVGFLAARR
jgi:ElaB/YqjD/DUF883 family membrane-anchored ribosome-binding protein